MNTTFSYALRMALCQNCGAPIEAAPGGGMFACRYCGAQNQLVARNEQPILAHQPQPLSEAERLMRLRQQDGRPLLAPPSLHALVPDGQLAPWKVNEAVQVWNSTRGEVQRTANYEASERLIFLTMVLANHFSDGNDLMRQRAMFESALDVCTLPRHKQTMRGYLSRCAARQGDLAAAEQWLTPCDRQSDDLETDSAYRFSRAFIDTARHNYNGVLQVLGSGSKDVPLMDAVDSVCAVLRANAWERVGQLQTAVQQLTEQMQAGAQDRLAIGKIVEKYRDWALCQQSYPLANSQHGAHAASQAAMRAGGGIHYVFIPLGLLFLLIGAVCVALLVASPLAAVLGYEDLGLAGAGPSFGLAVTFVPMGLIFTGIGFAMRSAAARAQRLRLHGLRGTGTVMNASPTGLSINNVPQFAITMMIQLDGRAPYQATSKILMSSPTAVVPGARVPVRVDPQNASEVLIETD
jgi:hypothetical protein